MKKNWKSAGVWFVGIVLLLLAGCGVYMRVEPDRMYAPQERRMLSERPKFTKKNIVSGKFQKTYEVYLSEQFPGREQWVVLETKLSRMLGNQDANGVYFGADDYLLERYREQDFDWEKVEKNVKRVAKFLQKYPQTQVLFVPVKSSVLSEKLPKFAQISGEERFFRLVGQHVPNGRQIPVFDVLKAHENEYIYYRTDHHWTMLGAYYAYEAWAKKMGILAVPKEQFAVSDVSNRFFGTTFAKVRTGGRADTISLYERKDGQTFAIDYNMGEFTSDSFYDKSKLDGEDPYSVFFGGNQALADIRAEKNEKKGDGRTLLIIKDSFGNCFAPFAANHYERTIVVDLRYVNLSVSALLQAYPADDVLLLYNSAQFMEDKDISKLK